jgi:hypothetical protein
MVRAMSDVAPITLPDHEHLKDDVFFKIDI